jgi:tetratricopeptide (TPR) repeat protein
MSEQSVRVFVSSPGDAMDERRRVEAVVERLNGEFEGRVKIELVRWETSYYSAHDTFQKQIPEAADCDLVVTVFRARLGTELPDNFQKLPSGEPYPSGSAYEVLSAIQARRSGKSRPDVYVFRYAKSPMIALDDPNGPAIKAEWDRLKQFFDTWFETPDGHFLSAYQNFDTTDQFAAEIEDCLRQWLVRRGYVEQGEIWDRTVKGTPFPGLQPYDSQREIVFFGRYLDTRHAIEHLREAGEDGLPFLLLIGASDAGKSSLMRAGILPQLVRPGTIPGIDLWRRVVVLPGIDPLMSLANALFEERSLGKELQHGDFATPEMLANLFAAGDAEASIAPIRTALGRAAALRAAELNFETPQPARLALGLDQAERLLLETNSAVAEIIAKIVAALVANKLAYVIVALRSDAYQRFQLIDSFRDLRTKGVIFDVVQPGRAELEDIIIRPVVACRPPLEYEVKDGSSLATTLIRDAGGPDELPLLQLALARLFKAEKLRGDGVLRFNDYSGLGAAVSETAQDALMTLDNEAKSQLPALILALVSDLSVEPGTETLIPVSAGFVRPEFERNKPSRTKLVDAFIANGLLVAEGYGPSMRVRPTHEALLRIWPEAQKIIQNNTAAIRFRHVLQPIVRDWAVASESHKCDYAALPPALLGGARQVMEACGEDLSANMRAFISQALELDAARREQEIQQRTVHDHVQAAEALAASEARAFHRTVAGLAVAAVLATVALWQWHDAQRERSLAEKQLSVAVSTANSLVSDFASKFRDTAGVPIGLIVDILERVSAFQEKLGEDTPELKQSKADAQAELATTFLRLGNTGTALDRAGEAHAIYRDLAQSAPQNEAFQWGLSWTGITIGDISMVRGDLESAYSAYNESLGIASKMFPLSVTRKPQWQHVLSETENKVGDVLVAKGDIARARAAYQKGLDIAQLQGSSGANANLLESDLAWSYSKFGDVDMAQHQIEHARADYYKSLEERRDLAEKEPNNTEWQHDVWLSDNKFAAALEAGHDFFNAFDAYQEGRDIVAKLAAADPDNTEWQYELAVSYRLVGEALQRQRKTDDARTAYMKSLDLSEKLDKRDADNTEWKIELIEVNLQLAEIGDQAQTRLDYVIDQLTRLKAENKLAPDKVDLLTRATADRAKAPS